MFLIGKLIELDNLIFYHGKDIDLSSYDDEVNSVLRKYVRKTIDDTAKGGLTLFWELFTVILALPKISNVNNIDI